MRKRCSLLFILLIFNLLHANCPKKKGQRKHPRQLDEVVITPQNFITSYKASDKKYFDLLSTKLNLTPVFKDKILNGVAELSVRPHF